MFDNLLRKQKYVDPAYFEHEMVIGSVDAPFRITMVTNLYCNPCREKHKVIEELVGMYPDKVSISIRFVPSELPHNKYPVRHLLTYWFEKIKHKTDGKFTTSQLLAEWFRVWDFEKFSAGYPIENSDNDEAKRLESQHRTWISENGINATPTFFLNGFQLPQEYSIDDLLEMTVSFSEEFFTKEKVAIK